MSWWFSIVWASWALLIALEWILFERKVKKAMNQHEARKRQQLIELTLAGLNEMLVKNRSLLAEMDPEQERRFADLLVLGQDLLVQVDGAVHGK